MLLLCCVTRCRVSMLVYLWSQESSSPISFVVSKQMPQVTIREFR